MAVEVSSGRELNPGTPRSLFQAHPSTGPAQYGTFNSRYDVSSDGKRFIILEPIADAAPEPFKVVVNWTEELKQRVPVK
jgi:hypothetical protein